MKSLYEELGGTYVWNGDYQIPQLATDDRPSSHPLGKYGRMRLQYLQEEHPGLYSRLILSGKLYQHLEEVDNTCRRRLDEMIPQIAEAEEVKLKYEKKALSPIHVLKHREYDRAIADQEEVIHTLQKVEGRMLKKIGVKDGSDIKLRADQLQTQITHVNQAMQATEEKIHVCEAGYQELAKRSKQYDSEELQRKRISARAEIENNIAVVVQEKTGAAVSPLTMEQSIAEADKLLSVPQHEIHELSPERRDDIFEDHV